MRHHKTPTVAVQMKALGIVKKGRDRHILKISSSPSLYEIQKIRFAQLLISFGVYFQCVWKNRTEKRR